MLQDRFCRSLKDLRISVTDRCNFRCIYCMPEAGYAWMNREEILRFEEIERLARVFVKLGVQRIKLTGGEPLVRKGLETLIEHLLAIPGIEDLSLTTNGSLLKHRAKSLRNAGLKRLNVSLDTLDPLRFRAITLRGSLDSVLEGLHKAKEAGFSPIKINAVIRKDFNADQIIPLASFCQRYGFELRFIEFMDTGSDNGWNLSKIVDKQTILEALQTAGFVLISEGRAYGRAPAVSFRSQEGSFKVGIIASVSEPFCSSCTRARLTSDGKLVTCLFADEGYDLKALLRSGASDREIEIAIKKVWQQREDRYSEDRTRALDLDQKASQPRKKKIEMIRLGG